MEMRFRDEEGSFIEKIGYGKHIFYPVCVHQFLSPNDNKLHGRTKAKWRGMFKDFDDDVAWSAGLMRCLDEVAQATIRSWWERNLFLKGRRLRDADVEKAISGAPLKCSSLHNAASRVQGLGWD